MTADELRTTTANLRAMLDVTGAKWDESMVKDLLREVGNLHPDEVHSALQRCKAELRFPAKPVDVTDRCPTLRVATAQEAWASIAGKSDADTIVWTDLTAEAWGISRHAGDETAQRMAFNAAYSRLADEYKSFGRRPKVQVSLGEDVGKREGALQDAVNKRLVSPQDARRYLGLPDGSSAPSLIKQLPAPVKSIPQGVVLTDADRAYIASWQSPRAATPSEIEIRHRLGPYAADKLRLFMLTGQTAKTYASGCLTCGCEIPEDVTHCRQCAPVHRKRCEERQRKADEQNQRERVALDRMRAG